MTKRLVRSGDLVGGRFKVSGALLGEGSFSEVYPAADTHTDVEVALKIAKDHTSSALNIELKTLKDLQESHHVCRLIESGSARCRDDRDRLFIAMQLVGKSIADLRKEQEGQKFTWLTTQAVFLHMLDAIEHVHRAGYVHRDVKPHNFTVGHGVQHRSFFIIDFGLARKWKDDNGEHCKQRIGAEFRGSSKYASIHALKEEDQGRRDDLWSLLYVLVEFHVGELPWTQECKARKDDKDVLIKMKDECIRNPEGLASDKSILPPQISRLSAYLTSLNFEDAPDYQRIRDIVLDGATPNLNSVTFDWEQPRVERTSGAWFERAESAAATPMPVHNQSAGWPKHAAPDLTPVDGPGGAKRARVEHMSTPAFSEALALQSHISGPSLSAAGSDTLRRICNLGPGEVMSVIALSFRLLASHADTSRLQPFLDDVVGIATTLRDRGAPPRNAPPQHHSRWKNE